MLGGASLVGGVTYKNQPGIHASGGSVPLAGTKHLYTVKKQLWPDQIEDVIFSRMVNRGRTLHVCCGHSKLGDVRFDADEAVGPDVIGDAARLPFADREFPVVLCDPPYNGKFQWNHDVLSELARVAAHRLIFQHWFIPANPDGRYKKDHTLGLTELFAWQPRTYFGRGQFIAAFDRLGGDDDGLEDWLGESGSDDPILGGDDDARN